MNEQNNQESIPIENNNPTTNVENNNFSENMSQGAESPLTAFITMGVVAALNLMLLATVVAKSKDPNDPQFGFYEMLKQSAIVYLLAQAFGLITLSRLFSYLKKYEFVALPLLLSTSVYLLNVIMGYALYSNCNQTKEMTITQNNDTIPHGKAELPKISSRKYLIWFAAILPAIAVWIIYFGCFSLDFMISPFNELLGGGKSSWAYFMAIGFWAACVIWPSVSVVYFSLKRFACTDDRSITIGDVSDIINDDDEEPKIDGSNED